MSLSADNPFRTHASFWRWYNRAKTDPEAEAKLAASYREAWGGHGYVRRTNILIYLIFTLPDDGVDLVWEGLASRSQTVQETATIAAHTYVRHGLKPSPEQQKVLLRLVWKSPSATAVGLTLWILQETMPRGDEELLWAVSESHPRPDTRSDANYELLRLGHPEVVANLVQDMPLCKSPDYAAERLLWETARVHLTARQLDAVYAIAREEMGKLRSYASRDDPDPWLHSAVHMIEKWVQGNGMPFEPGDIDLVGVAAITESEATEDRLDAIKVLGWFNNDAGNAWLLRLTAREHAEPIRRAARRQLKKNNAT